MNPLTEFERGRIEGALAFWAVMAQYDEIQVPAVDSVLGLPAGTTRQYLEDRDA